MNENDLTEAILVDAERWHRASERDEAMDWDALTAWLEADPRHQRAFDELALTALAFDDYSGAYAGGAGPEQDSARPARTQVLSWDDATSAALAHRRGWKPWAGVALAASLAAVLVVPRVLTGPAPLIYATGQGPRQVALADGSGITLAPHSRMTIEGRARDRIALSGGALFDIRHDPRRQLTVTAGNVTLSDIGTRFDVQTVGGSVRVAVGEGQIEVSARDLTPVQLAAGKALAYDVDAGSVDIAGVKPADVGAWRDGKLSYDNAPLTLVAADLRRYAGVAVDVPVALRSRRFSGTLIVEDGEKTLRSLALLMGLRLGGRRGTWRFEQP